MRATPGDYHDLNLATGREILYEVQVRTANACDPTVGNSAQKYACAAKIAPKPVYKAGIDGFQCNDLERLNRIKLGTLDDMLENTADYRQGITVRYIREKVGATAVWLMPLFPNNDTWKIPDGCDNLGSPYAVRDYLHARGTLSRECILKGQDEYSSTPCWGNNELEKVIAEAHSKGLKVMLDVALNHFGHNYLMYDYVNHTPIRERIASKEDLNRLWKYNETEEESLLRPELLDSAAALTAATGAGIPLPLQTQTHKLNAMNLAALNAKCPNLSGDALVRSFNMWREALDSERAYFSCDPLSLEAQLPGFYMGRNATDPSKKLGDNFTNNWVDVKFLYHHEENEAHKHQFVRNREYLFRVMNYWVSRGVDGFRLDHTTDPDGKMGANEWKYILSKVNYYAKKRGQKQPIYLAEEFGDQMGMSRVVDLMTEGYVGDMNGRNGKTKDAHHVENVVRNMGRFKGRTYVMSALETHDEHRLLEGTGFNVWTGAGFWGIGATTWSTPMILMGQEFGETEQLPFRKSAYLPGRFKGTHSYREDGTSLVGFYNSMMTSRLAPENRALVSSKYHFLRTRQNNSVDSRIFAQIKWTDDLNVVFTFHNLWEQDVKQSYFIPPEIAQAAGIKDDFSYQLIDVLSNQRKGACRTGSELKWDFYIELDRATRMQWLRLERCQ
jgi:hypothetical protein